MNDNSLIYRFFQDKSTDNTLIQIIRYFIVGLIAVAADFALLIFLTEAMQLYYLVSAALGFLLGLAVNYTLSTLWVFNRRKLNNKFLEIFIYALTGFLGITLTETVIWFFTDQIHLHYVVSKTISFIIVYLVNFFVRKKLLF